MADQYSNKDEKTPTPKIVKEQEATYYSGVSYTKEVPDYVKEDILISFEQYRNGLCRSVSSFLKKCDNESI